MQNMKILHRYTNKDTMRPISDEEKRIGRMVFEKSFEIMCWKMRLNNLPSWLQEKILYSLESLGLPTPLDNKPPN